MERTRRKPSAKSAQASCLPARRGVIGGSEHTLRTGCGHHADTHADRGREGAAPTGDKSRPWLLRAGRPRRPGSRLHTAIRRAFVVSLGQPLLTVELVRRCYPRAEQTGKLRRSHCVSVRRAARKVAVAIGHGRGHGPPLLWVLRAADAKLIGG
jgi:hypothetical protein